MSFNEVSKLTQTELEVARNAVRSLSTALEFVIYQEVEKKRCQAVTV